MNGRYGWRTAPADVAEAKRGAGGWRWLRAYAAKSLHVWVMAATAADVVRTAAWMRSRHPYR